MQSGQNSEQANREAQREIRNQRLCVISVSYLTLSLLMFGTFYQNRNNRSLITTYIFYIGLLALLPTSYGAYTYFRNEGSRFFSNRGNQNNPAEPNNEAQRDNDLEQNLAPNNNP